MPLLWRAIRGVALLCAILAIAGASLVPELLTVAPPLSWLLLLADARVLLALLGLAFLAGLGRYALALHAEDPTSRRYSGPTVEALVPAYQDSEVLHRSVEGLAGSQYEDLTITILVEPDDEATRARATELASRHESVRLIVNEERTGTKAGALNVGIEGSDADVIGIFDADQDPHIDLVPHAVASLEGHDIASVKSIPRPTGGLLEAEGYYEFLALYFLPQQLVKTFLGTAFVGSQSVLMQADVFERVGTYAEDTLTEDMEFTHRCNQAGLAIRELHYAPCFEEPVHTLRDWWGQRLRWMSGHLQVGTDQLRGWRRQPNRATLSSVITLVGTFVAGAALAMTVPKLLLAGLAHPVAVGAGLGVVYAALLATRVLDNRTADMQGVGVAWVTLPIFFSLYGLVIVQVLLTHAIGWERDWYHVEKGT